MAVRYSFAMPQAKRARRPARGTAITVRLTEEEDARFKRVAQRLDLPVAAMIRHLVRRAEVENK